MNDQDTGPTRREITALLRRAARNPSVGPLLEKYLYDQLSFTIGSVQCDQCWEEVTAEPISLKDLTAALDVHMLVCTARPQGEEQ